MREAIGPDALILVNANDRTIPRTAPYVVVYNPPGNRRIEVKFDRSRRSRATGQLGPAHSLASGDGDIFLND